MLLSISMYLTLKNITKYLFIIYLLILMRITVFRDSIVDLNFFNGSINMHFFIEYLPLLKYNFSYFVYLFFGNIVWFIPLGFFLVFFKNLSIKKVLLIGFCLSLFIEIMQYILSTGISEFDDLILNSIGTFVGAYLATIWRNKNEEKTK